MSRKEKSSLFGVTISGDDVTPTMVSGIYKQSGNTQDGLSIVELRGGNE